MDVYNSEFSGATIDARLAAVATMQTAISNLEAAIAAKYSKPADGIPETDMDSAVQSALAKARSAVQDLSNYYTKTEIDSLLAAVNSQEYVDVATLPTASASTLGKIYLVGPTNNQYDRYYTSYDGSAYSWVAAGSTEINLSNYATKAELNQLEAKLNTLASTRYYGIFASSSLLPADANEKGYAYVGATAPFSIYEVDYNEDTEQWEWTDTGATVDAIQGRDGVGFDDANSPTPADGTAIITLTDGSTITIDLNHTHQGYEETNNKVTSISSLSTDTQYPSAKCMYDLLGDVESLINAL